MAIKVEEIKKTLGGKEVIRDISFTAPTGKITGVLGPNGAGKTTTFNIMLNIMSSDNPESRVTYGGDRLGSFSLPLTKVGFSMEIDAMDKKRKAVDHLRSYAPLADCSNYRIDELLEHVGLGDAKKQPVGSYSMGMKQRLALAMSLLGDPDFLILDEPANGLDPDGIIWIRDYLRKLADSGKTVIVSSHLLNEAQKFIDYVVVIKQGVVAYEGDLADLKDMCSKCSGRENLDLEDAYQIITTKKGE